MDLIASVLGDIPVLVWGERAMYALGVQLVGDNYVFVVDDVDFDDAVQRLRLGGFRDCSWSYGSREPSFYKEKRLEHIYRRIVNEYSNVDRNSTRFFFPSGELGRCKIVLLRSSYAHICVRSTRDEEITRDGNLIWPNAALLLRSFVQILVREPVDGMWTASLSTWVISYLYGQLKLSDDVLDACDDEDARAWFNERIRRFDGGLDCVTRTKRLGRVDYGERLASL